MISRRYLTIATAIFTPVLMAWTVVQIIRNGITLWTVAVLAYLALVSVMLRVSRGDTTKKTPSSPLPAPVGGEMSSEKTAQEIILNAIRTKGKAQRHDLLPLVKMSKSTLGRLLDKMEAEGLVVQVGVRKASHYALPKTDVPDRL